MRWRDSKEYRHWKIKCKERDGQKCCITGYRKNLHVHHLNHASYFRDQRYQVSNGITVTRVVHTLFHIFYMRGYRKKCTKKDWSNFVRLFKYIVKISKILH